MQLKALRPETCFLPHRKHCILPTTTNRVMIFNIIIIIIIFLHGLGRLTCSGIDALPSFPRASTISSSSRFVVEGVFRQSGVVHSFKMVDPVLFVFGSHVLYSGDLWFVSYNFASYFGQSCVSFNTSQKAHLCSFQASHVSRRGYPCFAAIVLVYLQLRPYKISFGYF